MLVLFYPLVLFVCILVAFFSFLFRHYRISLFFSLLACLLNIWCECFPIRLFSKGEENVSRTIKVLLFNVNSTQELFEKQAPLIARYLIDEDADVLFIPELLYQGSKFLLPLLNEKYPYSPSRNRRGVMLYSEIFLSKWPMSQCEKIDVDKQLIKEVFGIDEDSIINTYTKHSKIYKTSVDMDGRIVSFIGSHLIGNNYYSNTQSYSLDSINSLNYLCSYLKNVHESYRFRAMQADAICKEINNISSPLIVMGDMNDIGGSYTIRTLESKGLEDAWWKGGFGYGSTFRQSFLNLRLDHILYSPNSLKLLNVKTIDTGLSDHKCLVAEFELK